MRCHFSTNPIAVLFFFFQAEDGIRDGTVTGVQTCALPILPPARSIACTYMYGISAASSCQLPHDAGSTYVVIPTTGLATFEHPLPLVGRDHAVEELLLRAQIGRASCRERVYISADAVYEKK